MWKELVVILITGGRGRIARATVARLHAAGHRVRVVSRAPDTLDVPEGVEVVGADLASTTRASDWTPVLDGVTDVLLYADPGGVDRFLDAASARIVLVSALVADDLVAPTGDPIARMHQAAEAAVRDSGLPWTFLRAGGFATNALGWAASIRAERVVRAAYPESHSAPIHEQDIADVAALVLSADGSEHEGRAYALTGPESLTQREQVDHIAAVLGEAVRFEEISAGDYRAMLGQWGDDSMVDTLLARLAEADGRPALVSTTYQELTGRPGRSFARWARDHVDSFR
ncbi:Uncharacterized conserved protein YbjT, contains NAD(P)-binding and DUF2867 domains [Streptoalloteichus tenebrarius]|uniref:Uncharacterized conserved protein YbjT, contains NAD(P)-binding and DUF2867 domains n=1 Tax=Streptoalloteichus tenebrarius (strain ATCC 17920 / DSM 40477 / JCM 4838 / CBS 697.72 / NBRC 16177 / NCIMB 11028 / NRRL B-12390 / A12253. 1 / ISP 5477) TaxID=1933 RepID=A0ABT1HM73_STRSD|nr:NAD(P)H-binding protein [Streptoalloteichus tenebrarius]MCP2256595.1 Uncharacterized conserved protein YbjT, contains NAD(P)-binding and DUF2867 domains [Streptoalloteichus tenebrarius]BFF04948.1 NAD(P)H-binding protein [Streptoalloteichus tenebrarius]